MATSAVFDDTAESVADVLGRLGGVPPERVVMRPFPATEDDLLERVERTGRGCELIDGVLVEKPVATSESNLAGWLITLLNAFVVPKNLGLTVGEQGMVRLFAGQVRMPDVSFVSWGRCPNRRRPAGRVWEVAPDLAVEVLSESNTPAEMLRKRQDYFRAGVAAAWEIDPAARTVAVFTTADTADRTLAAGAVLDGAPALPGFSLALAELFGELDRHG